MAAGWKWSVYTVQSDGQTAEHLTATGVRGEGAVSESEIQATILPAIRDASIPLPVGIVTYCLRKPALPDSIITGHGVVFQRSKPFNKALTGYIDEQGRYFKVENGLIIRPWDAE